MAAAAPPRNRPRCWCRGCRRGRSSRWSKRGHLEGASTFLRMSLAEQLTNTSEEELRRRFEKDGYIVVPGLLKPDEVERYKRELQRLSGLDDSSFDIDPERRKSWTKPDGVTT